MNTKLPEDILETLDSKIKTVKKDKPVNKWKKKAMKKAIKMQEKGLYTVNLEIFARVLFSRNSAYAKIRENETLVKWRDHSVVDLYR